MPLTGIIANSAVQSSTRTLFTVFFVHRHLNNARYIPTHSLIGEPYLEINATNITACDSGRSV